jgi:CheY-like chemotaxis protein
VKKPSVTGTTHTLPFEKLDPHEFERLCLWLMQEEGYSRPEHFGYSGNDQGRDIMAYKGASMEGEELWCVQCKRCKSMDATTLQREVDKLAELSRGRQDFRLHGIIFLVSCPISANTRDQVGQYCEDLGFLCEFWAHTELDMRVKKHPRLLEEFFQLPVARPPTAPYASSAPRILVVEDDPTWQEILREGLIEMGYLVEIATSFNEARSKLQSGGFSLITIDARLHHETITYVDEGMLLLDYIRSRFGAALPVIIVSGEIGKRDLVRAFRKFLVSNVLLKEHFEYDEFRQAIRDALQQIQH